MIASAEKDEPRQNQQSLDASFKQREKFIVLDDQLQSKLKWRVFNKIECLNKKYVKIITIFPMLLHFFM